MASGSQDRENWNRTVVLSLILFGLMAMLSLVPLSHDYALRLSDTLFRVTPPRHPKSQVVLILIDDESLQEYGRWPWSRTLLAQLTRNLNEAGAEAIGLDILLSEPQSPEADLALTNAIKESKAIIVDKIGTYPDGPRWIEPLREFRQAAGAIGHAQAVLDRDGVCRRYPLEELTANGSRLAFAVKVAQRVNQRLAAEFLSENGFQSSDNDAVLTRVTPRLITIPYRRGGFITVSAASVLRNRNLGAVRGHPVLVGFGPTEISDRISTPLSGELPESGVEIHAQILDSILSGRRLRETPIWLSAIIVLFECFLLIALLRRWRGWKSVACIAAGVLLVYGAALAAFIFVFWLMPVGALLLAVVLGPLVVYVSDFVAIERSITKQLKELQEFMSDSRTVDEKRDLSWRLALLRQLQSELGSLYQLHSTLLETTQDAVAIFDDRGHLLLNNRRFRELYPARAGIPAFDDMRSLVAASCSRTALADFEEGEAMIAGEPHATRIAKLPPTRLTPEGGSVVTLASLKLREERDRARYEALGFVTHELRAPLVAIQGFAELMMRYPESPSCEQAPQTIFRESKRLLALISSYLDVLRLDAGARPIRWERVEIGEVCREVLDLLSPIADAAEMELRFHSEPPVIADADRSLLTGSILNLISNAIKYGRTKSAVTVSCIRNGGTVVISVHNEGEPIESGHIERLFDRFYRVPKDESFKPGSGLGLAFVKRIVEKHGGGIRVESGDAGTTFAITLPAEQGTHAVTGAA